LNDNRLSDRSREKSDKVCCNAFTSISTFFALQPTQTNIQTINQSIKALLKRFHYISAFVALQLDQTDQYRHSHN